MKRVIVKFIIDAAEASQIIASALVGLGRVLGVVLLGFALAPVALCLIAAKTVYTLCKKS
jgi:hypothetical protein